MTAFSRRLASAIFVPRSATAAIEQDEEEDERRKVLLRFDLQPGCYATVLIKRLYEAA